MKGSENMCCESGSHHGGWHRGHGHGDSCGCGCEGHSRFGPRFWTKDEKIAWLEQYLEGLQEEAQAVEERIAKLKGEE
jgi:hypothetical protein